MSSPAFRVELDYGTLQAFRMAMDRYVKELDITPKQAVQSSARMLLRSLRAQTLVAPKVRKVVLNSKSRGKGSRKIYKIIGFNKRTGKEEAFQTVLHGRTSNERVVETVFANRLSDAKANPRAIIKNSGMARKSWNWAIGRLFAAEEERMSGLLPQNMVHTEFDSTKGYARATVENKFDYIRKALPAGGLGKAYDAARKSIHGHVNATLKRLANETGCG